ncbi:uncharacterized protein LOC122354068 [Puntigrus tetrazona]|uniref:uncharacterized protein LOC122328054 n=1 Tax=Puntigrus tetrazona TaxID=1606681 RepID=UPI001C89B0ED|nr:uncharacterized protein LOC122328054 [Puntigrus tetrazona]XP_043079690.1 uncharacterized protein LOC122328054 [Puntigrus tetrazona]XP_043107999.1 uncharacterized protein LOC122354068 [Puntigrus tetrazona]XP_043108000.1 uncharacterized protein LOC122354068 [Puntigrus tetrazona]
MEEAAKLCELLFGWLEKREQCAEKLSELARELERVHQGSNISQVVGAATSVLSIFAAALATVFTGGLAGPVLVAAAAAGTVAGTAVSVTSTLVEAGVSSSTIHTAVNLINEDEKVGRSIQQLLQDLRTRCGGGQPGPHASGASTHDVECELASQIMCALARRNKTTIPLNLLRSFNRATFFRQASSGGLPLDKASHLISKAVGLVCLDLGKSGLKVSAKEMVKDICTIGMRASAKAGSRALGVIGLGMSLYDLIATCEEIMKDNQVTEASKFLRDSAREILEGRRKLKEQLDAMHEIIYKLLQLKKLVKDLGGYSLSMTEDGQKIMNYIIGTCTENSVVSWLQSRTHQIEFTNVLRFYQEKGILEELSKRRGGHMDLVFVAHGRIVAEFMPAGVLVPGYTIRDTILYSPWNCRIDDTAAYSIAQGNIRIDNRNFSNLRSFEPDPLPDRWNSMLQSRHNIPGIILSPLFPEELAWGYFNEHWTRRTMDIDSRVIVPYVVPQFLVAAFGEIPFCVLLFAASFVLMLNGGTATAHLAACLDRGQSPERREEWRTQYAWTNDEAFMSVDMDERIMNPDLFRALRSLFDRNRR